MERLDRLSLMAATIAASWPEASAKSAAERGTDLALSIDAKIGERLGKEFGETLGRPARGGTCADALVAVLDAARDVTNAATPEDRNHTIDRLRHALAQLSGQ